MFSCIPFWNKQLKNTKTTPQPLTSVCPPHLDVIESPKIVSIPADLLDLTTPHTKQKFKKFCTDNRLCMRCSYQNPKKPVTLSEDGLTCPYCDSDEDPQGTP